ncbi:homogentisate 1,2-dioxygenase [Streptomyces sp. NPDC004457]
MRQVRDEARELAESLTYLSGFGNRHASEAVPGALPSRGNSPQRPPFGLYVEQVSGSAFTEPRAVNRFSWLYRIRPSAGHGSFHRIDSPTLVDVSDGVKELNRMSWRPLSAVQGTDFLSGLWTVAGTGDPAQRRGMAMHMYAADTSMERVFGDSDGELLIVPFEGALLLRTELGALHVRVGDVALIPRGIRFRVELLDDVSRGYVAENFGRPLELPELGPLGANALANPRHFRAPTAAYEDVDAPVEVVVKYGGELWATTYDHSPLDVVAWHGNHVPYVYDMTLFQTFGTLTYDHTDPSAFTLLTSPGDVPGVPNLDFIADGARWDVARDTLPVPYYHRNVSSEIYGVVKAPSGGASPVVGGPGHVTVQNMMTTHGVPPEVDRAATEAELKPLWLDGLSVSFETREPLKFTQQALESSRRDLDYDGLWHGGYENRFRKSV